MRNVVGNDRHCSLLLRILNAQSQVFFLLGLICAQAQRESHGPAESGWPDEKASSLLVARRGHFFDRLGSRTHVISRQRRRSARDGFVRQKSLPGHFVVVVASTFTKKQRYRIEETAGSIAEGVGRRPVFLKLLVENSCAWFRVPRGWNRDRRRGVR
jgi:hypothetical protein